MNLRILSLVFIVLLAGCASKPAGEGGLKNDVVTIENYFVSPVAPYEKSPVTMQFDVKNNGDQTVPYLEVDFFDTPGFKILDLINCERGFVQGNKCIFENVEPLDLGTVTLKLMPVSDVISPTPQTVSFAVRYVYLGSREITIPVIDGETRKQPLTQSRESSPSVGPVVLEINPELDRQVSVDGKTISQRWAAGGKNPLPFIVKFKFNHIGNIKEKVTDINISLSSFRLHVQGLDFQSLCSDFCNISKSECLKNIPNREALIDGKYFVNLGSNYYKLNLPDTEFYSTRSPQIPTDAFICTFEPNIQQPEYSATIAGHFAYKYEFIKKQDFVIQPLPT